MRMRNAKICSGAAENLHAGRCYRRVVVAAACEMVVSRTTGKRPPGRCKMFAFWQQVAVANGSKRRAVYG